MKKQANFNVSSYIRREQLDGLELFSGSFDSHAFKPHFHECYTIVFVKEGVGDYSTKRNKLIVPSGSILLLTPYEVHTGKSVDGYRWGFLTAYVPKELVDLAYRQLQGSSLYNEYITPRFKNKILVNQSLFNLGLDTFTNLSIDNDPLTAKSQLLQFLQVFLHISNDLDEPNHLLTGQQSVSLVKDYLHDHFSEEITIEQLCHISGLTEFSLIKSFKRYFDLPPHQYLINLRVEKAKQLLKQPVSSAHIAYQVGFYDQSHFIRHFKNIVGVTPKKFKDQKVAHQYILK
ncbi:MAG: AraC family transcriptional regulator [Bacteroidota bacterium]